MRKMYARDRGGKMKNNKSMRDLLIVGIGVSVLFLLVPTLSFGVDFYVSSSGSGGTGSKASPWGPSEIPWSSWESGSTDVYLYFFGGTYTSTLAIRHNYTGNHVYIKPGSASPSPSGISGQVIFQRTAGGNITFYSGAYVAQNVTIDGETTSGSGTRNIKVIPGDLGVNNPPAYPAHLYGIIWPTTTTVGNKLRYLEITGAWDDEVPTGFGNYPGGYVVYARNAGTGTEIAYCHFHDNWSWVEVWITTAANAYGIASVHHNIMESGGINYIMFGSGADIYNNILDSTTSGWPYDIIHNYSSGGIRYVRIFNNDFKGTDQMIFLENTGSSNTEHIRIYNNTFTGSGGKPILFKDNLTHTIDDVIITGNTFYDTAYAVYFVSFVNQTITLTNLKITNNIFYSLGIATTV